MIVFDLKCGRSHVFEAWFASSEVYETQRVSRHIRCPLCDDDAITKAVMAPAIPSKGNRNAAEPSPAAIKSALTVLAARQAKLLESSEWVGSAFADRARAMHLGDETHATIHGQASVADVRALVDEGVPIAPLPLPVVPPRKTN